MGIRNETLAAFAAMAISSVVEAGPVTGYETTLLARDLTGDGIADAYFSPALSITWMRDANNGKRADLLYLGHPLYVSRYMPNPHNLALRHDSL